MSREFAREVHARRNQARFEEAKARHSALAPYPDLPSALDSLESWSSLPIAEKNTIIGALLAERQIAGHSVWSAALLQAFAPMLSQLRACIVSKGIPAADLDQIVVISFLEAADVLGRHPGLDLLCLHLRQATRRRVFRHLRGEQAHKSSMCCEVQETLVQLVEQLHEEGGTTSPDSMGALWPAMPDPPSTPLEPREQAELSAWLTELAEDVLQPEEIELVVATQVRGEMLTRVATRLSRGTTQAERQRDYERIKRSHCRALGKLRRFLKKSQSPDRG